MLPNLLGESYLQLVVARLKRDVRFCYKIGPLPLWGVTNTSTSTPLLYSECLLEDKYISNSRSATVKALTASSAQELFLLMTQQSIFTRVMKQSMKLRSTST